MSDIAPTTTAAHRPGRRWQLRLATLTSLSVLAAGLALATPATASAAFPPQVPCPTDFGAFDIGPWAGPGGFSRILKMPVLVSKTPTFNVADTRAVTNDTGSDGEGTFTVTRSKTFTLEVSAEVSSGTLLKFLQLKVTTTVRNEWTTSIGLSVVIPVPAHTTVIGDYGMFGYDAVYDVVWLWQTRDGKCYNFDFSSGPPQSVREARAVPTNGEGWHFHNL